MKQRAVIAACLLAALLSACGGGSGSEEPLVSPTAERAAATATAQPSPTPDVLGDKEADGARILEHVRVLSEEHGPRVAGSENERDAVEYLRTALESYGYEVELQEFQFDSTRYRSALVVADGTGYPAITFRDAPYGTVSGLLIDAGIGRPEEFPAGGLNGAIALIARGDLTFAQKAENAAAAGAGAIIIYNNEEGPLVGDAPGATAPIVGITARDGQALKQQLAAGQVEARVEIVPPTGTAYNVIARPRGVDACTTVTGGHADSVPVSPGADDNASGSAGVLEMARLAAANGLPGANCFVLFGAEELGLWGSLHYVAELPDAELNGLRGMINVDVIGTPVELTLIGSADLVDLARVEAQEAGIEASAGVVPSGSGSDHFSFQDAGVPVVFFYRHDDMIHTRFDDVTRIDAQALEDTVRVAYATLEALAGAG